MKLIVARLLEGKFKDKDFSFTVQYPPMTRSDFAPVMAFVMKQRSRQENFTVTFPSYLNAQGNETGTLLVNGVHAVADTTIAIDGFAVMVQED